MVTGMPTKMVILIVIMLVLLGIGIYAIVLAGGLSVPLFDQIDNLLKNFALPGGK